MENHLDPIFWDYSIQTDPPIHVIVEHGRVTFTGVVRSQVEKRKAEFIARSVSGCSPWRTGCASSPDAFLPGESAPH